MTNMKEVYIVRKKAEEVTGFESITQPGKSSREITKTNEENPKDTYAIFLAIKKGLKFATCYQSYIEKHGCHFTEKLAYHVSKEMVNVNDSEHCWSPSEVKAEMSKLSLPIPKDITLGDVTYLANMYYSDFYPNPLREPKDCFMAAYNIATDPDGYPGMIFMRWTADLLGKGLDINWEEFT